MLRLIGTELSKQIRRPRTWVALGFVAIVPIIIAVALKLNPPDLSGGGRGDGPRYFYLATQSGLFLPVAALRVMAGFFLVVVICMFAGDAVASEAGWGNLRYLLVRPVSRGRLLTAKLFVAAVFAIVATALVALSGLVAGVIAFGWHPITIPFVGVSQSTGDILGNLALAVLLITWGLAGIIAFGFMLSTMTDSAAGAIFASVGLYIVSLILGEITSLGAIRYGLPVHYYDAWSDLFTRNQFTDDMWRSILLQIPYVIVFLSIAWWWFHRKDIKS
ncbi:MAG: ABC transporter permease [Acidimicrobiia bacterium]